MRARLYPLPASWQGWRRFAGPTYRPLHGISSAHALLGLVGDAVFIPFLLALGCHPAIVTIIAALPPLGMMAQRLLPRLLKATNGNLRGLTLLAVAAGETRGFWLALVALFYTLGWLPAGVVIVVVALTVAVGQTLGLIAGANLQAWYSIILPEAERRFAAPRAVAISMGLSAFILLPASLIVGLQWGTWPYVIIFSIGGLASLLLLWSVRKLPNPGRVRIPQMPPAHQNDPRLERFLRSSTIGSGGAGVMPYVSIYAIAVLGMPASFAIALSALSGGVALIASLLASDFLSTGSASRLLRMSLILRGVAALSFIVAFPGMPLAPFILVAAVALSAAGWSSGMLAANERLFRLAAGPSLISHQGRYVLYNSAALSGGQIAGASVLAIGGLGYPLFASLFAVSGLLRLWSARETQVSDAWTTSTGEFVMSRQERAEYIDTASSA